GGIVRQKPDFTAADGVSTSIPAFTSYYGTSAAASHAAAIAALLKSAQSSLTAAQMKAALASSAIDIMAPGFDRDSGNGAIMAQAAVASLAPAAVANLSITGLSFLEGPGSNADGGIEPGETGRLFVTLANGGAVNATSVSATLALATPVAGVSVSGPGPSTIGTGTIAPSASAANGTPFTISLGGSVPCGQALDLVLTVSFGGGPSGASPLSLGFRGETGAPFLAIKTSLDPSPPSSASLYTAASGTQTGRLAANERVSTCENPKTTPGLATASGARRYDAFTLTNTSASDRCITVTLSSSCNVSAGTQLYVAAYDAAGFDPSDPSTHYLADAGVATLGVDETFSVDVPASTAYTVVVSEMNPGATNSQACPYTLTIDGPPCHGLGGLHGDANGDAVRDVQDVFYLINYLFAGGPAPVGFADVNGDGVATVNDVFYLINYLFAGGPAPV
ncbi:MAG TPA: dockerin type I domain-containing protein, partial [Thermoanaerobaculia bacterium]|nr:dockerin type I domain-containing protein [Thermoanaerobaculia bacterium]